VARTAKKNKSEGVQLLNQQVTRKKRGTGEKKECTNTQRPEIRPQKCGEGGLQRQATNTNQGDPARKAVGKGETASSKVRARNCFTRDERGNSSRPARTNSTKKNGARAKKRGRETTGKKGGQRPVRGNTQKKGQRAFQSKKKKRTKQTASRQKKRRAGGSSNPGKGREKIVDATPGSTHPPHGRGSLAGRSSR